MLKEAAMRALFEKTRSIAILGAKDVPGQPVDRVGRYLIAAGFTIFPVHPKRAAVWGLQAYPELAAVPEPVDIVDLFRAAAYCPCHAREALAMRPRPQVFWMQQGISSPEAAAVLENSGIVVVEDACIMVAHQHASR